MRNSILPIFLVLVTTVIIVICLRQPSPVGLGGPTIFPGIYRQVTNHMYQVESMGITQSTTLQDQGAPAAGPGLPAERFITVSGDDRSPLTAAVMYALAEAITKQGGVALLDPLADAGQDQLPPLDCAWYVRIATLNGEPPATIGGALDCTVRATAVAVRLADDHPAAGRQEAGLPSSVTVLIHHTSQGTDQGGWPQRYAADGRAMADALLADLGRGPAVITADPMPDWGSTLPLPPRLPELRWHAAFQRDLIRGWEGHIDGLQTVGHDGNAMASLDRLEELLTHGKWELQPQLKGPAGPYRIWHRQNDDGWLSIRSDAAGHDVVAWWERPEPAALFCQWLDAAKDGVEPALERATRLKDRDIAAAAPTAAEERVHAREALSRYRDCPCIPADYRSQAAALLATTAGVSGSTSTSTSTTAPVVTPPAVAP